MKKFMSIAIATALIASMCVPSFAATNKEPSSSGDVQVQNGVIYGDDAFYIPLYVMGDDIKGHDDTATNGKGQKFYIEDSTTTFPIGTDDTNTNINEAITGIVDSDDIEDWDEIKLTVKITDGKEYVKSCYIDEIDDDTLDQKDEWLQDKYAIVVEMKDFYDASTLNIKGTATIKKKSGSKIDDWDFNVKMKNTSSSNMVTISETNMDGATAEIRNTIDWSSGDDEVTINYPGFDAEGGNVVNFKSGIEMLYLEGENFNYEVKMSDQGKVSLAADNKVDKSVSKHADANADLTFFNFKGRPTFDFTGTMTITFPEDNTDYYLYEIDNGGTLTEINASMTDDDDGFEFKTRTLSSYVLSDQPLDAASADDSEDNSDTTTEPETPPATGGTTTGETDPNKGNPGTGSSDFVGVATALAVASVAAVGAVTLRKRNV